MDWTIYFTILGCFILGLAATIAMVRVFYFGIGGSTDDAVENNPITQALLMRKHSVTDNDLRLRYTIAGSSLQSRRDSDHWSSQLRKSDDGKGL